MTRRLSWFVLLSCAACASPNFDVASWQAEQARARPTGTRGRFQDDLRAVERLRRQRHLAESRDLALALAAERPADPSVLILASRAESDAVFLHPRSDKKARALAALSALAYARRAVAEGASDTVSLAQLAWALGTTTHLQPMKARSAHAAQTKKVAARVLHRAPDSVPALATLALLHLRLQTLPWIARVMASDLPASSLQSAERYARRGVELAPSVENRMILAKVLAARDRQEAARAVLDEALAAGNRFPRDAVLRDAARRLREDI